MPVRAALIAMEWCCQEHTKIVGDAPFYGAKTETTELGGSLSVPPPGLFRRRRRKRREGKMGRGGSAKGAARAAPRTQGVGTEFLQELLPAQQLRELKLLRLRDRVAQQAVGCVVQPGADDQAVFHVGQAGGRGQLIDANPDGFSILSTHREGHAVAAG